MPYQRLVLDLQHVRKQHESDGPLPSRGARGAKCHVHPSRQRRAIDEEEVHMPEGT